MAYASSSVMDSASCGISVAFFAASSTRCASALMSAMNCSSARLGCERHAHRPDAAPDDFHRWQDVRNRGDEVGERDARMRKVAVEHQRDFRLYLRLKHAAWCDFLAVVQRHVVEQHAEVGRVYAELLLHGFGG